MSTERLANRQESTRTDIRDNRESTLTADQCTDAMTPAERTLAEVLADVLRINHLSVESHFFDELGADSLVMAKFCARVRKRSDLPSISMQDIYRHPTIRSLAAALTAVAPRSAQPPLSAAIEAATLTSTREYILCGVLQALFLLAYSYVALLAIQAGYAWVEAGSHAVAIYRRLVLASSAAFFAVSAVPIAAKWLLIGRWKPQEIRLWSLSYVRFWIIKTLIRSSPATRLFIGTPLYSFYLRVLGAKIGRGVVILSRRVPICTDLLTIGAGTVIRSTREKIQFAGDARRRATRLRAAETSRACAQRNRHVRNPSEAAHARQRPGTTRPAVSVRSGVG